MIYLDHNATTPVLDPVLREMLPYFREKHGNASSAHPAGQEARKAVQWARRCIAKSIGADLNDQIIFTSGGTEANNMVLWSAVKMARAIVTSTVEHHAILRTLSALKTSNYGPVGILMLEVDHTGAILPASLENWNVHSGAFVSVMHANNETGNILDVKAVVEAAKLRRCIVHTDAVQSYGKIPVNVDDLGVDLLTISAHKVGGPKGIGALYIRKDTPMLPFITGGHQEGDLRAGTENVPAIVGFGKAAQLIITDLAARTTNMRTLRDYMARALWASLDGVNINNKPANSLPNTINLSFDGVDGEALAMMVAAEEVCISHGAACETGQPEPSHVLKAMGRSDEHARGAIRISLGIETTKEEVEEATCVIEYAVKAMRGFSNGSITRA